MSSCPPRGVCLGTPESALCSAGARPRQLRRKNVPALGRGWFLVFGFFPPFCWRISRGLNSPSHQQFDADCDSGAPRASPHSSACTPLRGSSRPWPWIPRLSLIGVSVGLQDPGALLQTRLLVPEQQEVGPWRCQSFGSCTRAAEVAVPRCGMEQNAGRASGAALSEPGGAALSLGTVGSGARGAASGALAGGRAPLWLWQNSCQ